MSFHAANPAAFPHLSPCPVESANKSLSTRNYGGELRPSYGGHCRSNRNAIAVNLRNQRADENFALSCVCRYVSVFCSVTASGPFRRPAALGLLLRTARPFGVSVPPKTSLRTTAKYAAQTSFGRNRDPEGARSAKQKTECRRAPERSRSCDRVKDGIHDGRHRPEQSFHLHTG